MIIYDPSNKKDFDDGYFDDGSGISFRYLNSKFGLSKYIPYGPNVSNIENIDLIPAKLRALNFLKLKVDLPYIYEKKLEEKVIQNLKGSGFKQTEYLIDNQTILINNSTFNIEKKDRYYVKKSEGEFEFELRENFSKNELEEIYKIYLRSSSRQEYTPKKIKVFEGHLNSTFSVVAKKDGVISGFILGERASIGFENIQEVLYNLYTGANETGLKNYVGYGMYNFWLTSAFEKGIDIVNMYGSKQGSSYTTFKRKFVYKSEEISTVKLPGSFEKYIY